MLALVGSGEYLPGVDPIDRTLISRLPDPVNVVCLPTAAGTEGEAMIHSWMKKGVDHFTRLGVDVKGVPVKDSETAHDMKLADQIRQANFVYLSGGKPNYLAKALEGSPVWEAIVNVHQRGGVVAGCSAGAMIMGEEINGPGGRRPGFNLLPNSVIMPHFDEFPGLVSRVIRFFSNKSMVLVGIDGNTALIQDGDHYEVLGTGRVTIISNAGTDHYTAGPLPAGLLK